MDIIARKDYAESTLFKNKMHANLRIFVVIFLLSLMIPVATSFQLTYNKDKIPMFELNNSSLIETIKGHYVDSNNSTKGGGIVDYDDANVNFDYTFFSRSGFPIDNQEVDILKFNINYKIKNNVKNIIPLSFDLGEWPQFLSIIDPGINVEITDINAGNSSLLIYGKNKSILISKIPPIFKYILTKHNESTILSIVGGNASKEGRLEVELRVTEFTPLQLSKVNLFKEYSAISFENEKIKIQTDLYKDFDYPVSSIIYFDDPSKAEQPFSNQSELSLQFGVFNASKWNFTSIVNDSEELLLMAVGQN